MTLSARAHSAPGCISGCVWHQEGPLLSLSPMRLWEQGETHSASEQEVTGDH